MNFELIYSEEVVKKDIASLSKTNKDRVRKAIEDKLATHPEHYGKPLRKSLKGYRVLRVANYRVVFRIECAKVLIFAIKHRSVVYKGMKIKSV